MDQEREMESQVTDAEELQARAEHSDQTTNILGTPWYKNAMFDRYWKTHSTAWAWYRHHCKLTEDLSVNQRNSTDIWGSRCPSTAFPPTLYGLSGNNFDQASTSQVKETSKNARRKRRRRKLKREKKARLNAMTSEDDKDSTECDKEDGDQVVFEMEITPEMREFFAKSAKHKQEREAEQREKELSESMDYIDLTEVTMHTKRITAAAPTERPGAKRTEQMKYLYGSGAAMIHGMETALQLNFDRNYDLKTPKLWPHLPLNITFHS